MSDGLIWEVVVVHRGHIRAAVALSTAAVATIALAACGGGSSSGGSSSGGGGGSTGAAKDGGTVSVVQTTFPDSLDNGFAYVTQAQETTWLVYTPLLTYRHATGTAGTELIPGLASGFPKVSDGGRTYTATLRKGQRYSNGKPVQVCDVRFAIERAVTIPWGGAGAFLLPIIQGAQAFANHKAKTISGITCDNSSGRISFHLTRAYGAFDNVLAEPATAPVPTGSVPVSTNEPLHPPVGDGPYVVKDIVANQSYSVDRNPRWKPLPGIPAGHVDVNVKINGNVGANAEAVLNNTADVFDFADDIPGSLLPQIQAKAADRYKLTSLGNSTYYFFMNTAVKPFSSQLAREAVVTGLNQDAYNREAGDSLVPACFFLPPAVIGHPKGASCPYGAPGTGDLAKAKQLVKQSGMAGQKVTVWSQTKQPRQQWGATYTQYLNQIGFKATQKVLSDATYFSTVGERKLHAQTGFSDWIEDFPNPVDFYGPLLDGSSILENNNRNLSELNDPHVNSEIQRLGAIPTTQLAKNDSAWQQLDQYVAKKAYLGIMGYSKSPFFTSDRLDYGALKENPIYGWDFSSFQLKK